MDAETKQPTGTLEDAVAFWEEKKHYFNQSSIAKDLKISRASMSSWQRVPEGRVAAFSRITGVPQEILRPDLVPKPYDPWD